MMRLAEISIFFAAASAVHVAAWMAFPHTGVESSGATGDAAISLAAASGEVVELVDAWSRPVEVMVTPDTPLEVSALSQSAPVQIAQPAPSQPVAPQPPTTLPAVLRQPDPLPSADTAPAIPTSPDTGPETSLRPQSRPPAPAPEPPEPVQKQASKPAPSSQAQTASNGQTGQNAGRASTQTPSTKSTAQQQSLMRQWGAAINNRVERQKGKARRTGAKGTATLRLTLSVQGRLLDARVVASSGDARLDNAALAAVRRARYPSAPAGLDRPQYQFNLPLRFD